MKADNIRPAPRSLSVGRPPSADKSVLSVAVLGTAVKDGNALPQKPIFTVLVTREAMGMVFEFLIRGELGSRYQVRFLRFRTEAELVTLARRGSFDAAVVSLWGAYWDGSDGTLEDFAARATQRLVGFRRRFAKPVIAVQGLKLMENFRGTGITFLEIPCEMQELRRVVRFRLED
jgi:hypothetical protein